MRIHQLQQQTPTTTAIAGRAPRAQAAAQAPSQPTSVVRIDANFDPQRLAYDAPSASSSHKLDAYRDVEHWQRRQELASLLSVDLYV